MIIKSIQPTAQIAPAQHRRYTQGWYGRQFWGGSTTASSGQSCGCSGKEDGRCASISTTKSMLSDFRKGPVELADDLALVFDPGKELVLEVTG
jgi:hypothetical protein